MELGIAFEDDGSFIDYDVVKYKFIDGNYTYCIKNKYNIGYDHGFNIKSISRILKEKGLSNPLNYKVILFSDFSKNIVVSTNSNTFETDFIKIERELCSMLLKMLRCKGYKIESHLYTTLPKSTRDYWENHLKKADESWILKHSIWLKLCGDINNNYKGSNTPYLIADDKSFLLMVTDDVSDDYIYFAFTIPEFRNKDNMKRLITTTYIKYDKSELKCDCYPDLLQFWEKMKFKNMGLQQNNMYSMKINI